MKKATNIQLTAVLSILFLFGTFKAHSQTQAQMDTEVQAKYSKANKKLNVVYQQILKDYAKQPIFINNFKTAERLWVQLRDAELEARYPAITGQGSLEPMCRMIYLTSLTEDRIKHLQIWLDGITEGESCTGSVKIKH